MSSRIHDIVEQGKACFDRDDIHLPDDYIGEACFQCEVEYTLADFGLPTYYEWYAIYDLLVTEFRVYDGTGEPCDPTSAQRDQARIWFMRNQPEQILIQQEYERYDDK